MVKESRCGVYKSVLIRSIINWKLEQSLDVMLVMLMN